jgi:hypothetical protein
MTGGGSSRNSFLPEPPPLDSMHQPCLQELQLCCTLVESLEPLERCTALTSLSLTFALSRQGRRSLLEGFMHHLPPRMQHLDIAGYQFVCAGGGRTAAPGVERPFQRLYLHEVVALLVRCPGLKGLCLNLIKGLTRRLLDLLVMCKLESQTVSYSMAVSAPNPSCPVRLGI